MLNGEHIYGAICFTRAQEADIFERRKKRKVKGSYGKTNVPDVSNGLCVYGDAKRCRDTDTGSDQVVGLAQLRLDGGERLALGLGQPQPARHDGREAEQGRHQVVAVHAAVDGQHGVHLERQERDDGQRDGVDGVGYGSGVRREQLAVDGRQQRAQAQRVRDGQAADGQHAQPTVIGDVVAGAPVQVEVREDGRVEDEARGARDDHERPAADAVGQHGGRQRGEQDGAREHQRQPVGVHVHVHLGERDGRVRYERRDAGHDAEHGQALDDDQRLEAHPVGEQLGERRVPHLFTYAVHHGVHLVVHLGRAAAVAAAAATAATAVVDAAQPQHGALGVRQPVVHDVKVRRFRDEREQHAEQHRAGHGGVRKPPVVEEHAGRVHEQYAHVHHDLEHGAQRAARLGPGDLARVHGQHGVRAGRQQALREPHGQQPGERVDVQQRGPRGQRHGPDDLQAGLPAPAVGKHAERNGSGDQAPVDHRHEPRALVHRHRDRAVRPQQLLHDRRRPAQYDAHVHYRQRPCGEDTDRKSQTRRENGRFSKNNYCKFRDIFDGFSFL